jgi:CRISPR-associated exonuclease Cas4
MIVLVVLLVISAFVLFLIAHYREKASGFPSGRLIYTDTHQWEIARESLYDSELGLTGKPDYLVAKGKHIIPLEVKSGSVREGPYDSHIYQLAAYCLLVERTYGLRPPYGILHYIQKKYRLMGNYNQTFALDFTPELESSVMDLIKEMRAESRNKEVNRSHESIARCQKCGFRSLCDQRLT